MERCGQMVNVKEDMTGWKMWEHGVQESRLIVVNQDDDYVTPSGKHYAKWICKCSCKEHTVLSVLGTHLKSGAILSYGCLGKERRKSACASHGKSNTKLYSIWKNIKMRCYNPQSEFYYCYGGKGITMCDEWKDNFDSFYSWAVTNGYDPDAPFMKCTIDRINVNDNYCPENCRWVDKFVQAMNHGIQKNNTSGVRGVKWDNECKRWYAQININNKRIYLGRFNNKDDAIVARLNAELTYLGDAAPQRHLFKQYKINENGVSVI